MEKGEGEWKTLNENENEKKNEFVGRYKSLLYS